MPSKSPVSFIYLKQRMDILPDFTALTPMGVYNEVSKGNPFYKNDPVCGFEISAEHVSAHVYWIDRGVLYRVRLNFDSGSPIKSDVSRYDDEKRKAFVLSQAVSTMPKKMPTPKIEDWLSAFECHYARFSVKTQKRKPLNPDVRKKAFVILNAIHRLTHDNWSTVLRHANPKALIDTLEIMLNGGYYLEEHWEKLIVHTALRNLYCVLDVVDKTGALTKERYVALQDSAYLAEMVTIIDHVKRQGPLSADQCDRLCCLDNRLVDFALLCKHGLPAAIAAKILLENSECVFHQVGLLKQLYDLSQCQKKELTDLHWTFIDERQVISETVDLLQACKDKNISMTNALWQLILLSHNLSELSQVLLTCHAVNGTVTEDDVSKFSDTNRTKKLAFILKPISERVTKKVWQNLQTRRHYYFLINAFQKIQDRLDKLDDDQLARLLQKDEDWFLTLLDHFDCYISGDAGFFQAEIAALLMKDNSASLYEAQSDLAFSVSARTSGASFFCTSTSLGDAHQGSEPLFTKMEQACPQEAKY